MPTAPAEVRAVARYVAPSVSDEGVARMIEALVLVPPAKARAASARLEAEAAEVVAEAATAEAAEADGAATKDDLAGDESGTAEPIDRSAAPRRRLTHGAPAAARVVADAASSDVSSAGVVVAGDPHAVER
jgi:hypothetical protein